MLEIVKAAKPHPPTSLCCLYIGTLSVYYLLLCSLLLLQDKFPHRSNKAELNYTELNWNKRHSTTGSLATASWCKARAGRKSARAHTHAQKDTHSKTHISPLSFMCVNIICKTVTLHIWLPCYQCQYFSHLFSRAFITVCDMWAHACWIFVCARQKKEKELCLFICL